MKAADLASATKMCERAAQIREQMAHPLSTSHTPQVRTGKGSLSVPVYLSPAVAQAAVDLQRAELRLAYAALTRSAAQIGLTLEPLP